MPVGSLDLRFMMLSGIYRSAPSRVNRGCVATLNVVRYLEVIRDVRFMSVALKGNNLHIFRSRKNVDLPSESPKTTRILTLISESKPRPVKTSFRVRGMVIFHSFDSPKVVNGGSDTRANVPPRRQLKDELRASISFVLSLTCRSPLQSRRGRVPGRFIM